MLTTEEPAKIPQLTEPTVAKYAKAGQIPGAVKLGKSWRFPDDVIERMTAAQAGVNVPKLRKRRAS